MMPSLAAKCFKAWRKRQIVRPLLGLIILFPAVVSGQGSGRDTTGTGGNHIIQGKIFFPSGRRAEGTIQVRLSSFGAGDLTTIADSNGSFAFSSLSPGNYTVIVNAGNDYEVAREAITIDSEVNPATGTPLSSATRRYTVMITLQLKSGLEHREKLSVIDATLAQVPAAARDLYEKALNAVESGNSLKAIDNLRAAISLYPGFALALNELGVQYLKLGQPTKAVEAFKSATELNPGAFIPRLNLGVALVESDEFPRAEAELRAALGINSTAIAHMYLGLTLAHLGKDGEAEKELKSAIELGGNQLAVAQAHKYLGGLYWRQRKFGRAADELEIYLRLAPHTPETERLRETIKELRSKS
jgi:tetratricopeptide (TPR) repeat protein